MVTQLYEFALYLHVFISLTNMADQTNNYFAFIQQIIQRQLLPRKRLDGRVIRFHYLRHLRHKGKLRNFYTLLV